MRVSCDEQECPNTMRVDQAEVYIILNDGSPRYACPEHMRQWRRWGFLHIKPEDAS